MLEILRKSPNSIVCSSMLGRIFNAVVKTLKPNSNKQFGKLQDYLTVKTPGWEIALYHGKMNGSEGEIAILQYQDVKTNEKTNWKLFLSKWHGYYL